MINTRISASSVAQAQELSGSASNGNSVLSGLSAVPASSRGRHSSLHPSMAEANAASGILRNARQHGGFISADDRARLGLYQRRGAVSQDQINSVFQMGRLLGGARSASAGSSLNALGNQINKSRELCEAVEGDLDDGLLNCSPSEKTQLLDLVAQLKRAVSEAESGGQDKKDALERAHNALELAVLLHQPLHTVAGSCSIL